MFLVATPPPSGAASTLEIQAPAILGSYSALAEYATGGTLTIDLPLNLITLTAPYPAAEWVLNSSEEAALRSALLKSARVIG